MEWKVECELFELYLRTCELFGSYEPLHLVDNLISKAMTKACSKKGEKLSSHTIVKFEDRDQPGSKSREN